MYLFASLTKRYHTNGLGRTLIGSKVRRNVLTDGFSPTGILQPMRFSSSSVASSSTTRCVAGMSSLRGNTALNVDQYNHWWKWTRRTWDQGTFPNLKNIERKIKYFLVCNLPCAKLMSEVYSSGITLFELLNNGVWTPRPSSRKVLLGRVER